MGVASAQGFGNRMCHAIGIAQHLVIPEANDAIAFRLDQSRARGVFSFTMLSTVDLDHQSCAMTGKVGGVAPKGHLPPKMLVGEILANQPPESCFRVGGLSP